MRLRLFNGFALQQDERSVRLPLNGQRLVALVTLRSTVTRAQACGTLWPEVPDHRAAARLRTELWRLRGTGRDVIRGCMGQLFLDDDIGVDVVDWTTLALRIIDRPHSVANTCFASLRPCGDLLPGWYDDWILLERERLRQLQLHVLEIAADQLLRAGRHAAALDLALGALHMEQTRESAHRLVIRVHLAEGNCGEAWRQFERCEHVLAEELGVRPSRQLRELL